MAQQLQRIFLQVEGAVDSGSWGDCVKHAETYVTALNAYLCEQAPELRLGESSNSAPKPKPAKPKTRQTPYQFSLNPLQEDPKKTQNPDTYGSFEGPPPPARRSLRPGDS